MPTRPLLKCGPFLGLQAKADPYYLEPGYGAQASNVDTSFRYGAFSSAMGRNLYQTLAIPAGYTIQCASWFTAFVGDSPLTIRRILVFSAVNGSGSSWQGYFDPVVGLGHLAFAAPFTQAIQFGSSMWTNGGDKIFFNNQGNIQIGILSDQWQIQVPYIYSANLNGTFTTGSAVPAGTYTYAITLRMAVTWSYVNNVLTPDPASYQESSPIFSTSVTTGANQQPAVSVATAVGPQSTLVTGQTPGNQTYYGALYRASVTNPTYKFVNNLIQLTDGTGNDGNPCWIDTATDASLLGNAVLITHHDPPPIIGQTYPGIAIPGSITSQIQSQQQVSFTYKNPSFIAKHKSRVWAFTNYPTQAIGNGPNGSNTQTIALQPQLWYSDQGVPWSFDDVNGVLPVGPEDTPGNFAIDSNVATNPPWQPGQLEDNPMGVASTGSILVAFKSQSTWMLLGDSPAEFNQGVRKVADIGCVSTNSIVSAEGGVFWLAPQGVYFFNGGEPNYIGEDISGLIESLTWSTLQKAVGSYRDRTFYLSFDSIITLAYYLPSQKWYSLPYGTNFALWSPYNQNQLLFVNGASLDSIDVNPATDLGSPIVSTWQGSVSDSDAPSQLKSYRLLQVVAPIQPGQCTVTLTLDPLAGITNTYSATWDLSLGNGAHVVSLPPNMEGYEAQLTVTTTTAANATAPISIRSVTVHGDSKHDLVAIPHDSALINTYLNGVQTQTQNG